MGVAGVGPALFLLLSAAGPLASLVIMVLAACWPQDTIAYRTRILAATKLLRCVRTCQRRARHPPVPLLALRGLRCRASTAKLPCLQPRYPALLYLLSVSWPEEAIANQQQ